ncbi:transcription termination/antitermination protein NusA, partial [Campylobacter coli]|nr:transcription termination/antitermination protein NusA [Campylobacter coli]
SYIEFSKAKKEAPDVEIGDELTYECSLENLGRTAVNILHKELEYHIQKLLEQTIFEKYKNKVGQMVFGNVVRIDNEENTYIEIDELRAFLPRKNRIKGEKFKVGDVVKAVIRRVYTDKGIKMELSRTSPKFLECLLEAEVPEIKDGYVSVVKCARIPGERAKIILQANGANIDPVGATVGVKGVRINAVSKELHNENIDCIEFSNEPEILIARALAPAIVSSVKIENEKAIVTLNSEQKSKAIGKSGINIRLAGMLSGYEIELNEVNARTTSNTLSNEEALKNLQDLFKI